VHRDGEGWRLFVLPLGAHANKKADVEFRISSRRSHDRQFCFEVDSR